MRLAGAVVCYIVGGLMIAWGGIGDLLYSMTPEGRFGETIFGNLGVFVYTVVFLAGAGLIAAGNWLRKGSEVR